MLSIKGKIKQAIEGNSTSTQETKFDWKNCLIDSVVMASISGISTYIATQNPQGAVLSALLSFFTFMGIKRGIVEKHE